MRAFDGIDVAYYLIHSMEPSADGSFEVRERRAAERFVAAARAAGVQRIVYLGGLVPAEGTASLHLSSRLGVEQVLLESMPESVAFRASIVIGARSRSFRFMVRLVERLPVLALPGWHTNRTQPIDERDVVEILARAASSEAIAGQSLDIAGRDVVSYGELIERIRFHMLVGRPTVSFRKLTCHADRQPDRLGDRLRAARTHRSADGGARVRPAAARRRAPPRCSASACTRSTRRSSGRCATGSATSHCGRGDPLGSAP